VSKLGLGSYGSNVCFGSFADIQALPTDVRFTPKRVFSGKRWENQIDPILKNVILPSD